MQTHDNHQMRHGTAAILLFGLVFACYSNTLKAPWYFDDHIRIVNNSDVHLSELTPSALMASINPGAGASHSADAFFRPVAMLSFAVNWYLTGGDIAGFHLVNMLIHFLASVVLYHTTLALMLVPQPDRITPERAQLVALLAAVLWAVHPVQTQAVTYIIQRSTSLAGLFFITGIYGFIKGRQAGLTRHRIAFFGLGAACYLLGMGTKLNTAILPLSWLLVDGLFFQDLRSPELRLRVLQRLFIAGLLTIAFGLGLIWVVKGDPLAPIFTAYSGRPFTLAQRLMTEPRILIFYLSLLFFPAPGRFAFMHDISISSSLVNPWTTLAAILAVIVLVGIGLIAAPRHKFLSLAILFFFLNHLVESSLIPLELLYEHRNYLPSMFLFLPLAVIIGDGLERWRSSRRALYRGLVVAASLLIFSFGTATYLRNSVWASERAFWEDVLVKAPNNARPYLQLAAYYEKNGRDDLALKLYARSLSLYDPAPRRARADAFNNMGTIFNRMRQTDAAIAHFQKALAVNPRHEIARHNLLIPLITTGHLDKALEHAEILIHQNPTHPYYLNDVGYIRMKIGDLPEARENLEKAVTILPASENILINLGITKGRMADYAEAIDLLKRARRVSPGKTAPLLGLIEVNARAGNESAAVRYADQLVQQVPLERYFASMVDAAGDLRPYDADMIRPIVAARLKHFGASLN